MHSGAGRITKEIQKAASHRPRAHAPPHQAMIEKQAGVEVVAEIDIEFQSVFFDQQILLLVRDPRVLAAAALARSRAQVNVAGFDAARSRQRG